VHKRISKQLKEHSYALCAPNLETAYIRLLGANACYYHILSTTFFLGDTFHLFSQFKTTNKIHCNLTQHISLSANIMPSSLNMVPPRTRSSTSSRNTYSPWPLGEETAAPDGTRRNSGSSTPSRRSNNTRRVGDRFSDKHCGNDHQPQTPLRPSDTTDTAATKPERRRSRGLRRSLAFHQLDVSSDPPPLRRNRKISCERPACFPRQQARSNSPLRQRQHGNGI
jgi:hypothetical protein